MVATTGVILAAVYMLWAVQRAFTGEPDEKNTATREITFREICTVVPLLGLSLFLGFYPKPVLDRLQPSVAALVSQIDSHSDHHKPLVNFASEECVADGSGHYTVSVNAYATSRALERAFEHADHPGRAPAVRAERGGQVIALTPVAPIPAPSIDWFAIAPEIAMFSAALAIVLLRSLVRHHPRVHEASLIIAIGGVATSAIFTAVQWGFVQNNGPYQALLTSEKPQVGMVAVDGFAVFAMTVVLLATLLALLLSSSYLKREHLEGPEYFALAAVLGHRHDVDVLGERPRHGLPLARDPVDRAVRARRVRPPPHRVAGGRAQVLPARFVLVGGVPLRRRPRVRRDGHHQPHGHRHLPRHDDPAPRRRTAAWAWPS